MVEDLTVRFPVRGRRAGLTALNGVSLAIGAGEALGVVGESGSGKSTLARALLQLLPAASGRVVFLGTELSELSRRALRARRRDLQLIFQDPLGSLDPRMTVQELVGEPLRVHAPGLTAGARAAQVLVMLQRVGLAAELTHRYPHELSGGQCQRVGIARAMILKPQLLVCDEPVSALDGTTQEQIVTLLGELRRDPGVALLFISHNLALVRRLCERVLVLYLGHMMELAAAGELYERPRHPYTRELLEAVPLPDPQLQPGRLARTRSGEPPSPLTAAQGCVYASRCPHARPPCRERLPGWEDTGSGRIACLRWRELP
jgi:oligopeptide transport system ATP-binding protein